MALNIVEQIDDRIAIKNVLVSVSDKTGVEALAAGLVEAIPDVRLFSTGGTFDTLKATLGAKAEKCLVQVSEYTGQPEMQGGLVKTLDFKIYLGLLSETYNAAHQADLSRTGAVAIDMVVVNLYPFRKAVMALDCTPEKARTNIDIGGPCMIRAAAKNYLRVASVTDPADYATLLQELRNNAGTVGMDTRLRLMQKAFAHTASYDLTIAGYFAGIQPMAARAVYRLMG